jgi:hypothetical protein
MRWGISVKRLAFLPHCVTQWNTCPKIRNST